ncbi:MAG: LptA/OstA family protein [Gammaproteobacteria bacterium]|nr:LptA/OstA family protein [Gammaproteobacteria bacterium]MDP2348094.1 LptA/OstA family protein [Gammaproteobacteria bacterium]
MKLKVVNPDLGRVLLLALAACVVLSPGSAILAAQQAAGAHEYRADGETTIETVNGVRVITLRENVFVRQNEIELTGDIAVLEYNLDNELQQVRLTGAPAHFQQQPQTNSAPITGYSDTINYYAGTESIVEFIGTASFNQPGTTLQCAQIRHVIETGATSGQACSGSLSPQNPTSASSPQSDNGTALQQTNTGANSPQPN